MPLDRKFVVAVAIAASSALVLYPRSSDAQETVAKSGAVTVGSDAFAKACVDLAAKEKLSHAGADSEWLFLGQELKHLSHGAFWEKDPAEVTVAKEDAIGLFTDLKGKLEALGVEFIFVPVPAKAATYPDKLVAGAGDSSVPSMAPYLSKFSEAGITVIDVEPLLRADRKVATAPESYCKTDAHPTPATCRRIAALVAEKLKSKDWAIAAAKASTVKFAKGGTTEVSFKGDLIPSEKRGAWKAETAPAQKAGVAGTLKQVPAEDAASPVIVIGDSHAQIFSLGGEMLLTGSGVVDHLQADLGFPVYLATSRGSAVQAQRQIYKGADFWNGKKALVWIASARSFTQERRWAKLPRLPK